MKPSHLICAFGAAFASLIAPVALAAGEHSAGHGHEAEAIGKPRVAAKITRTVQIDMTDSMRFTPSSLAVKQGETVRFVVKNSGQLKHEMVLGTEKALREHDEAMKKNPEMEHADENMVTVAPGQTGEMVWQFTQAGKIDFACLQPGHYEAGMKGAVRVSKVAAAKDGLKPVVLLAQATPVAGEMVDGEVRKVDKENRKITMKHGEIKNLDMPGMTMLFHVKDPAMLDKVKSGDKVRFRAEKAGGAIVVTDIEVTK
mgnify:CR=1 FL=1